MRKNYSLVISSCDKFSDLWCGNILQLNKYWKDRDCKTYLITDKITSSKFENISIIHVNSDYFNERIAGALEFIEADYILLTLDDYFLKKTVDTDNIERIIKLMEKEQISYVRLFKKPRYGDIYDKDNKLYMIDMRQDYAVNLYPGIWRKDTLLSVSKGEPLNAWDFEVKLTAKIIQLNLKCLVSNKNVFPFLDVVRKGKILNYANLYFWCHKGIYHGDREVMNIFSEVALNIRSILRDILPKNVLCILKTLGRKFGMKFYS